MTDGEKEDRKVQATFWNALAVAAVVGPALAPSRPILNDYLVFDLQAQLALGSLIAGLVIGAMFHRTARRIARSIG